MRVIRNIIEHLPNQGLTILIRTLSFFTKPLDREALELIEGTILLGTTNDAELTTLSCLSLLKLLDGKLSFFLEPGVCNANFYS